MTYGKHDAFSDAYGDALNEFEANVEKLVRELIAANCQGQWRDDVVKMVLNNDSIVADFLSDSLSRAMPTNAYLETLGKKP